MVFKFSKKVYGFECDVYGHLNNANYLMIYESARAEALNDMDMPIAKLKDLGHMIYLVKVEIEYVKAIQLEEIVAVHTKIKQHNRLTTTWQQEIFNPQGELCNSALVTGVYISNGKPTRISKELCEYFDKFVEA